MAGIGFELRKLYRQQGLAHNVKAYAYSTMTTIGPMILCLILVFAQQYMMRENDSSYLQNELFVATMAYCFVFSIIVTSGLSMLVTRFIADRIYEQKYEQIITAYYGSLLLILPIAAIIAIIFLWGVEENLLYKVVAYIYFVELVAIWMQNVFLSALKDYKRIFRGFLIAVILSILTSFLLFYVTSWSPVIIALLGIDVGFASILILSSLHFEHVFPRNEKRDYFAFLQMMKSYPAIIVSGVCVYSAVYIHNIVYWVFSDDHFLISGQYLLMPFYDVAVFYAYLSVLPSLIFFVVIIETDFYEKFLNYYKNVIDGGTYESLQNAKKKMQKVLLHRTGFLAEIQLLFTILSIAVGILLLPKIGFSMEQLDLFITLCFGYFFFILMFILLHILMYFDDRKGVLAISGSFIGLSAALTYMTMIVEFHGMGMFLASFIGLVITFFRMLYIIANIDYYTFCPQPMLTISSKTKRRYNWKKHITTTTLLMSIFVLTGCMPNEQEVTKTEESQNTGQTPVPSDNSIQIDDKRLYERDDDSSIKTLYITVLPDEENKALDWYALNRITERYSEENLKIIMAEGQPNGNGPKVGMFGASETTANAKISIRGNTARNHPQKSYKIKLLDSAGTWNNQTTINLNKHISDGSRLRNKLSFDLMEKIPHISSLRTQFVHLYVKDVTAGSTAYEDYGLYTHVEQPNKQFLRNHLFDPNGYLYKVTFFEFNRYPEQIRSHTDENYDSRSFETILEIKGREEHDKLITMLNDVNDYSLPIEEVINRHFDEDNLLTWLAINILMDNMDTDANNFYLYSSLNNDKWLILPWDYDDGWEKGRDYSNFSSYRAGISNYWGNRLFNRYLKVQDNVDKLTAKIEGLYADYINQNTVTTQLNQYASIVEPYVQRYPDSYYLPINSADYQPELQRIIETPANSLKRYYEDLERPKPFYIANEVLLENNEHVFTWEIAFDLQNDDLFYNATIARDPAMQQVVHQAEKIRVNEVRIPQLQAGIYYLKVTATDSTGNTQVAFNMYTDEDSDETYFGTIRLEVE
ncbi:exopolysaccharide Pel transporter PelG [Lysinibacillus sp. KU-BSD001]|uniref:exopolysaccharide Pel transporter PelG n=1 Tax=Lysinibacillus sp. KU-BSD001 TaxID=3141328 RepID=UPI0036F0261B